MYLIYKAMFIIVGCLLVGVGINLFLVPHKLMDGGMIGLGLLANYYFQLKPGYVMLIVSIPIYLIIFRYNRQLFYNSFHGMVISSFFIDVLSFLREFYPASIAFSAIAGGVLIGTGTGVMLAYQTNTGGSDLIAQFLAVRTGWPVALLIFFIDGLIIAMSVEAIGHYRTWFSFITIVVVAVTTHYANQINHKRPPYQVIGPISQFRRDRI